MGKARDKGNRFEQDRGKWLLDHDGECPKWGEMATDCGRVGHITELGFDLVSKTYAGECKHRNSVPKWLLDAWKQIVDKAEQHDKEALFLVKKDARIYPVMHIITEEHHAELLTAVKEKDRLQKENEILRGLVKARDLE